MFDLYDTIVDHIFLPYRALLEACDTTSPSSYTITQSIELHHHPVHRATPSPRNFLETLYKAVSLMPSPYRISIHISHHPTLKHPPTLSPTSRSVPILVPRSTLSMLRTTPTYNMYVLLSRPTIRIDSVSSAVDGDVRAVRRFHYRSRVGASGT